MEPLFVISDYGIADMKCRIHSHMEG